MLWLHLGMPKTGTTALQGFLRGNQPVLDQIGLRYMETGRRRLDGNPRLAVSHNIIAFHMNQSDQPMDPFRAGMTSEFDAHSGQTCVVSSEMFYSCDFDKLAQVFAEIPARDLRIAFYCRRYSDFFEADYKQRAKNGRLAIVGTDYIRSQLSRIEADPAAFSFTSRVEQIRKAFPGVTIVPSVYEREQMTNGHVVDDFLSRIGTPLPEGYVTGAPSNPSQSRAASEAFGVVTRALGRKKSRQLRRLISEDPVMVRRHDVLEPDERDWLDTLMSKQDVAFQQEFFPDASQVFAPKQLNESELEFRRDTPQEYQAFSKASEIVFRMALES
ncbi:hypothetical protein [Ruegeria lacuscaerulensis]|uniref:hypothetical protein n=1 Tax=Ruegeria lacuscaerulensis TaxID=55218 RepID=UPI00147D80B5|nr:hypothetical protein [Ruegeria lacuscaerulensis]